MIMNIHNKNIIMVSLFFISFTSYQKASSMMRPSIRGLKSCHMPIISMPLRFKSYLVCGQEQKVMADNELCKIVIAEYAQKILANDAALPKIVLHQEFTRMNPYYCEEYKESEFDLLIKHELKVRGIADADMKAFGVRIDAINLALSTQRYQFDLLVEQCHEEIEILADQIEAESKKNGRDIVQLIQEKCGAPAKNWQGHAVFSFIMRKSLVASQNKPSKGPSSGSEPDSFDE